MSTYEIYRASSASVLTRGESDVVEADVSPFTIEVRFLGGLTPNQMNAFKLAADRWTQIIIGDLPSVQVGGEVIDDLVITAEGKSIDGPFNILGQAGPTALRPASAGKVAFLPAMGLMEFDSADLQVMENDGTLNDVITHEMGHVLGIGTIWEHKGVLKDAGTNNPTFTGAQAKVEYGKLLGGQAKAVPVANEGGAGTRDSHWREKTFVNELMTGNIEGPGNPISRLTVASLADLGYTVNFNAAEPYSLPSSDAVEALTRDSSSCRLCQDVIQVPEAAVLPEDSLV